MDAIRKKMQSLKGETDGLYATIRGFEDAAKEATARADQVGTGTTAVFLNCFHYKKENRKIFILKIFSRQCLQKK